MKIEVYDRFKGYDKDHCWQYQIRVENLEKDLQKAQLTHEEANRLETSDFDFEAVIRPEKVERPKGNEDKRAYVEYLKLKQHCQEQCDEVRDFIYEHEWLGKMPNRPTHRFTARLKKNGAIAGVIVMATPNAFSHVLGKENIGKEKLISRGACISWSPKNLGSWLIMKSVKWMVRNTEFRAFSSYSDPEAKELGTLYQACNFYYLGCGNGVTKQYFDPSNIKQGWFSDREFRKKSKYFMYAERLGISKEQWKKWMKRYSPDWTLVPPDIKTKIKAEEKKYRQSCQYREVVSKHKYIYILGRSKKETKRLRKLFFKHNPKLKGNEFDYPTERGK